MLPRHVLVPFCLGLQLSVRRVIWRLKASFLMMVFFSKMNDHVAIWVREAPAAPLSNLSTFIASCSFSSSSSKLWRIRLGIVFVFGLIMPFTHRVRDRWVWNPFFQWCSLVTLHKRLIFASWIAWLKILWSQLRYIGMLDPYPTFLQSIGSPFLPVYKRRTKAAPDSRSDGVWNGLLCVRFVLAPKW